MCRKGTNSPLCQRGLFNFNTVLILLGTGLLFSCGLETYTYLYPISTDTVSSDPTVGYYQFTHNTDNDLDEFLGYEIFYKLYTPDSSEILNDRSSLENAYLATESPITTGRNFSRLRLKKASDNTVLDNKPLLEIFSGQRGTPWVFRLDFSPLLKTPKEAPILIWYQPDGTTEVARFTLLREIRTVHTGTDDETFLPDQFLETDPDVNKMNVKNIVRTKSKLAVVFAVAAFGRKLDTTPIYSNIVFLNRSSSTSDVLTIDLSQ